MIAPAFHAESGGAGLPVASTGHVIGVPDGAAAPCARDMPAQGTPFHLA